MTQLHVLSGLTKFSSLTIASIIARTFYPYFSMYWWVVFFVFSVIAWYGTHVVVHKYLRWLVR